MKKLLMTLGLVAGIGLFVWAQSYSNETIQVGSKAPDLEFATPDGKMLKLSDLNKDRYVLVDFWASWCGPCRRANPSLVAMYDRYKAKKFKKAANGFTIYSVSLDNSKEKWMEAIERDHLIWPSHVSDLGGWSSKPATMYGITFIPQAFLLGPDGKVIGKYMLADQAEEDIKKLVQ